VRLKTAGLAMLCALAGCSGPASHDPPGTATIARGTVLVLPMPPAFPEPRQFDHIVSARFGRHEMLFESLADMGPDRVAVTITAPNGPRLATIDWSKGGIKGDRAATIPGRLRDENLLADMMLVFWPAKAIEAAMRPAGSVIDHPDGSRSISVNGRMIVEIKHVVAADGVDRRTLTNKDFHYTLTLSAPRQE
jgi:hypothetical protein